MFIQKFPSGPFLTNAYVIGCHATKQAAIIDPAPKSAISIMTCLEQNQFNCNKILLTHTHWDHIADVAPLKKQTGATVYVHPLDVPNLEQPGADGLPFWIPIEGVNPDFFLNEGDLISIGNISIRVIHTPGHSSGSVCLYCAEENILFSGDTLFAGTIGNLSFPTSQPDLMWPSLAKLRQLPPQTIVYPGHGVQTSIGSEPWLAHAKEKFG